MALDMLPPPRPALWPLRHLDSAHSSVVSDEDRVVITIEHAPLKGVTAEMLEWWFGHLPGEMEYAGERHPRYLVWHPFDHISYEARRTDDSGAVVPGTRLLIVEALGRDPDNVIDVDVEVEELGGGRAVIAKRVLGTTVVRLENEFENGPDGAQYLSRLTIGDTTLLGRLLLNRIAKGRAFPPRRIRPWMRHHVEEIGNLEHFLQNLFHERADAEP